MKTRRIIAVAATAAIASTGVLPVAEAQTYPEPLNQVMNEMRNFGGPQAPNLLLVPAALSSLSVLGNVVLAVLAIIAAAAA